MTLEGVDFSYARPGGAALVAAGKHFVVRYIGVSDTDGRALTAAEVRDYHAHGLPICLVFESTGGRSLSGEAGGIADARLVLGRLAKLSVPTIVPVYFAVDFDARPDQYGTIDAYLQGAASVLGPDRIGVYGHNDLLAHARAVKTARWLWQTYAWSNGVRLSGIHLYQYLNGQRINGSAVDLCRAYPTNYGQWAPVPSAPPSDVEEPMIVTQALGHVVVTATAGARIYAAPDTSTTPIASKLALGTVARCFGSVAGWRYAQINLGGVESYAWLRADETDDTGDELTVIDGPLPAQDCTQAIATATKTLESDLAAAKAAAATAATTERERIATAEADRIRHL